MSDWASIKAEARKAVHDAFAIPATYAGPSDIDDVVEGLRVRWHPAGVRLGDLAGAAGYAEVVTASDRVIFDRTHLTALGLTPTRGGIVTLTVAGDTLALRLDTKADSDGPVTETWMVTRE